MKVVYLRSLVTNWVGYAANVVVAFFLSPFIVHTLGDSGYGVWSLLMSIVGYVGLIDLGVRVSTGRYLNYYVGRKEIDEATEILNASFTIYSALGLFMVLLSAGLGTVFVWLFPRLPLGLASQAGMILPLLGLNMWLSLYSATFTQLLIVNNRFDLKNLSDMLVLAARALGTIWVLRNGYGIVGLSLVVVAVGALECVLLILLAKTWGVRLGRFRMRIEPKRLRELGSFGAYSFISNIASRVILYTDSFVIASLLGARDLAVYAIGFMVVDYTSNFLAQVVAVMTPDIYKNAGAQDVTTLRSLVTGGTKLTMLIAIPVGVGIAVFGKPFAVLWMGPEYERSGVIMALLVAGHVALLSSRALGASLWGLGEVRLTSSVAAFEAFANLTLSIVFVRAGFGIGGVALGTTMPMLFTAWIALPILGCRKVGMSLKQYFGVAIVRWVPVAASFALVCWLLAAHVATWTWTGLLGAITFAAAAYAPMALIALGGVKGLRASLRPSTS